MFLCFELAQLIMQRLGDRAATVVDEVHGFKYFDERDLLGFVDGTENPTGRAPSAAVTVAARTTRTSPARSYVIVQKYLHDLDDLARALDRGAGARRSVAPSSTTSSSPTT